MKTLWQKFSDNQVCIVIRIGPATYRCGKLISQKRSGFDAAKDVPLWRTYHPIASHFQPCIEMKLNWKAVPMKTNSSAVAERPRELGDFKEVGHFEAKF